MSSSAVHRFLESLDRNLGVEEVTALEACLDCRQCGTACAWHLSTRDPRLHPKHKKDFIRDVYRRQLRLPGRLGVRLGLVAPLDEATLREELPGFWRCNTCGRCSLACPLGLSTRGVVRAARAAFCEAGLAEDHPVLRAVRDASREQGHSFGLTAEQVHLRLGLFLTAAGVDAPFDVSGADYLYAGTAVANTRFPDREIGVPALLNAAGISYTLSSRTIDTGTDAEYVLVDRPLSRRMLEALEAEARRLEVRTLLVSECGCDVRTFHCDASRILGRPFRLPVETLDSLLLRAVRAGDLPVEKVPGRVTYHDPCKITRLSGLGALGRALLACTTDELVEMVPNGEANYCCNGGNGPLRLAEDAELRRAASRFKAAQIEATGAGRVVTPCSVCMLTLEDVCQTYRVASAPAGRSAFLLFEQVQAAATRALERRGELARLTTPALLARRDAAYRREHGVAGRIAAIRGSPGCASLCEWLERDPVVARAVAERPETGELLRRWCHGEGERT